MDFSFIEVSVFVALASTFFIYFFSSSGGFTSRSIDMQVQGETGIKMNQSPEKFSPSYAFYASILYLIGSVIATFFYVQGVLSLIDLHLSMGSIFFHTHFIIIQNHSVIRFDTRWHIPSFSNI